MCLQNKEDTISIGAIVSVHGIRGILKVKVYGDFFWDPDNCFECIDYQRVLFYNPQTNKIITLNIESISCYKSDLFLFGIKEIDDRNKAESMVGYELLIPKEYLPEAEQDEFYNFNLIGLNIMYNGTVIGKIKNIRNFGSTDLLEIELQNTSKTEYFPFTKENILSVDEHSITINQDSIWIQNLLLNEK